MDKYQENAILRTDLKNVTTRLKEVSEQIGMRDDYIDWEMVKKARDTVILVNKFYGWEV